MSHCQGCDEDQVGVRTFVAKFSGNDRWERVRYCPDCYGMAQANWNGETEAIAPTSGDQTGEDFNARVRAAAARLGLPHQFDVHKDGTLFHDGKVIGRFADEHAATDMAVRYAQDNDETYTIRYLS